MSDGRRQYERLLILIRKDQFDFLDQDANTRYPERHGKEQKLRGRNPAFRDVLDFWMAHYDIFLRWVSTRG